MGSNTRLTDEQVEENFVEINARMTDAEAQVEANRCLYCYDAPCTNACPTHIDVPSFIKKIATDNLKGSARVIFDANPIGASCARVCPVEALCEGACVEGTLVEKPIEIGRLQRYATDHVVEGGQSLFEPGEPIGKKVAIVGSGPAGLSCATYLARLGYDVTVFEKKALAGGLDTYGMAEYKMSQRDSLDEVRLVERLGVKIEVNSAVVPAVFAEAEPDGSEGVTRIAFSELHERYDAIFIGIGLGGTNKLGIPGEDQRGVLDALRFIEQVKTRDWSSVELNDPVAVIGAGNTAIDAVTQAKRLGAGRVMLVYRRSELEMPAYDYEYELAKKDGIEFIWHSSPVEVLGNGEVTGIRLRRENTDGELYELPCRMVIKAIGQQKQQNFFESLGLEVDEKGRVVVDDMMRTSVENVFAGGDCVNGGKEAVDASQAGKIAACGIHKALTGEEVRFAGMA